MRYGIIDIGAATCMIALAILQRESHWYWAFLASAGGILIGSIVSFWAFGL